MLLESVASNELNNCLRSWYFLGQHLASAIQVLWDLGWLGLWPGLTTKLSSDMCGCVQPGTLSQWKLDHFLIGFQLFEEIPPDIHCFWYVELLTHTTPPQSSALLLPTLAEHSLFLVISFFRALKPTFSLFPSLHNFSALPFLPAPFPTSQF